MDLIIVGQESQLTFDQPRFVICFSTDGADFYKFAIDETRSLRRSTQRSTSLKRKRTSPPNL